MNNKPMTPRQWCIFAVSLTIAVLVWALYVAPVMASEPHPGIVQVRNNLGKYTDCASGAVVTHAGGTYVLTCGHLFSDGVGRITVFDRPARVIAIDRHWDLAVLSCADLNPEFAFSVSASTPKVGDQITCVGWGGGLSRYRAVRGQVTQYVSTQKQQSVENLEVACGTRSGDSGGPMINTQGEIVGVLWGSDGSVAMGAYCGRIRRFLDAKLPKLPKPKHLPLTGTGYG